MIDDWKTVVIMFGAVGQLIFVMLYATFPWYRSFLGRALFFKASTLSLLLNMATAGLIWDWPNEERWKVLMYGLTSIAIWMQMFAFLRQKRIPRDSGEYHRGIHHAVKKPITEQEGEPV